MTEYPVLVADPPWKFGDKLPGVSRGAEKNYKVMPTEKIKTFLPEFLAEHQDVTIAKDAWLFLWRVAGMQRDALDVIDAWGFELKSELIWVKTNGSVVHDEDTGKTLLPKLHFGMGRHTRQAHEVCLIARRGKNIRKSGSVRSVFFAPIGPHSSKPEKFYSIVQELVGGPYLEFFGRVRRKSFDSYGNEMPEKDPLL